MPYPYRSRRVGYRRRRFPRRRYASNRTNFLNRKYSAMDIARGAWRGVKYIKSLINTERKFFDQQSNAAEGTTASLYNLSNIAEGDDYNQRQGNSVLCQSIFLRGKVDLNPSSTVFQAAVRFILFVDNMQQGTDPAISDLLENSAYITSPLLHTVSSRFNILMDRVLNVTGSMATQTFRKFIRYNRHIKYKSTTGADSSNWEGALYLFIYSTDNTNKPQVQFWNRLRYTDT